MKRLILSTALFLSIHQAASADSLFSFHIGDKWVYSSTIDRSLEDDPSNTLQGISTFTLVALSKISDTSYKADVDVQHRCIVLGKSEPDTITLNEKFSFDWSPHGTSNYTGNYFQFLNSCGDSDLCSTTEVVLGASYSSNSKSKYLKAYGTLWMYKSRSHAKFYFYDRYDLISYNGEIVDPALRAHRKSNGSAKSRHSRILLDHGRLTIDFKNRQLNGVLR